MVDNYLNYFKSVNLDGLNEDVDIEGPVYKLTQNNKLHNFLISKTVKHGDIGVGCWMRRRSIGRY